jgi:hypothetical protein
MSFLKTPPTDYKPAADAVKARYAAYKGSITLAQAEAMLIRENALGLPPALPAHTIATAEFIARIPTATWAKVTAARQGGTPLAVVVDQGIAQLCASAYVAATSAPLNEVLAQLVTAAELTADEKTQILSF